MRTIKRAKAMSFSPLTYINQDLFRFKGHIMKKRFLILLSIVSLLICSCKLSDYIKKPANNNLELLLTTSDTLYFHDQSISCKLTLFTTDTSSFIISPSLEEIGDLENSLSTNFFLPPREPGDYFLGPYEVNIGGQCYVSNKALITVITRPKPVTFIGFSDASDTVMPGDTINLFLYVENPPKSEQTASSGALFSKTSSKSTSPRILEKELKRSSFKIHKMTHSNHMTFINGVKQHRRGTQYRLIAPQKGTLKLNRSTISLNGDIDSIQTKTIVVKE